ncbi:hypothetical protein CEY12_09965 [Chryseobacterium sp. T16E-39]|uniref:hypothetical protein n=1 Tax=Chryseobacterium sp. T16E-39 TaxID=2015076 RepID=UPI000B5B285F|nr:hypothetical protein [Chryseobacterium sp. T16E-39]ASK30413.1 hypothetical protein CEY12_09965 [Chryseobacterium sp. T16E-39]
MRTITFCVLAAMNFQAQIPVEATKKDKRSMIEAGSFMSFSSYKERQTPGLYFGYWYRYPIDENKTHLEFGANFYHSTSTYDFRYRKKGEYYDVSTKEFLLNIGIRMVKEYPVRNHTIEWVSELSMHNLFFSGKGIPNERRESNDENTIYINTNTESIASVRVGQGLRFWKNNFGVGIQASYMPFRLLEKNAVPSGFNSFSIEAGVNFKL